MRLPREGSLEPEIQNSVCKVEKTTGKGRDVGTAAGKQCGRFRAGKGAVGVWGVGGSRKG